MKNLLLTLIIIIGSITFSNAQKISAEKVFGGYKFTQKGKALTMSQLVTTMKSNPTSYKLIKSAKSNNLLAMVLGGVGGALIGYPLGTALGGGEPKWVLAGVGAGLVGIGIPVSRGANKKAKQAVDTYNSGLKVKKVTYFKPSFKINVKENAIGLSMSF